MDNRLYSEILDNIPAVVFLINNKMQVKYYNEQFNVTFQPKGENLLVGNCINCANLLKHELCGQGAHCHKCILNKLLHDAVVKKRRVYRQVIEKSVILGDGKMLFKMRLSVRPISLEGAYVCVIDDISEIVDRGEPKNHAIRQFKRDVNRDLKRARKIQNKFLPKIGSLQPLAEFAYAYNQHFDVGGDFFDLYKISDTVFGGYIADVSGAGISGGMLTVFLHDNYNKSLFSPAEALKQLLIKFNSYNFAEESYITVLSFCVDTEKREIIFCNAGHSIPAVICSRDGIEQISLTGKTISNWYDNTCYQDVLYSYKQGDKIVLMTDGVSDMRNGKKEEYTIQRALSVIEQNRDLDIENMIGILMGDLSSFLGGDLQLSNDDSTLLAIQL